MTLGSGQSASFSSYAIPHLEDLPQEDTKQRVVYRGSAGADVSPWHDVPAFVAGSADVHCVVTAPKGSRAVLKPAYHEELNPLKATNGVDGKPVLRASPPPFHVGFIPQTYVNAAVASIDASGAPQVYGAQGKPSYQALQVLDLTAGRVRLGSIQRLHVLGAFGSQQGGVLQWTIVGAQVDDSTAEAYRQEIDALGVSPDISAVEDAVLRQMLSNAAHWLANDRASGVDGQVSMLNQGRLVPPAVAENLISVFHKAWANLVFTPSDDRALFGFDVLQKAFPGPWTPAQGWQPPVSAYATAEQAAVYQPAALAPPDAAAYYGAGAVAGATLQPMHETAAGTASIVQRSIAGQEGIVHAGVQSEAAAAGQAAVATAELSGRSVKLPGFLAGAAQEKDVPTHSPGVATTLHTFGAEESAAGEAYLAGEEQAPSDEELQAWETFQSLDSSTATWEQAVEAFSGDVELAKLWRATHQAHMMSENGAQEVAAGMPSLDAAAASSEQERA